MTESDAAKKSTEQIDKELEEAEAEEGEAAGEEAEAEGGGDCDDLEISSGTRKEGTCTEEGTKWTVVNEKTPLRLETIKAKLLGIEIRKTISGSFGESETADGVFVTAELEVTNLGFAPAEFEEDQAIFTIDGNFYTQDFEVQNGYEERSFLWNVNEIQPKATEVGTITFDMPEKVVKGIRTGGNLDILNFGSEWYGPEEFFEQEEVGTIRTYK